MQIMEGWRHFYQEPNGSLDYTFSVRLAAVAHAICDAAARR